MISAIGADPTHHGEEVFDKYLVAKGRADDALRSSGVPFTIVRPTRLTDDDPVGSVALGESADGGPIPRADVAAVLAALIEAGRAGGLTLELTAGDTPIDEAVAAVS
jgi:cytosine deaminase